MKQGMIRRRKERYNDFGDSLVCKYLHGSFSTYRLFFLDLSNSAQYLHWATWLELILFLSPFKFHCPKLNQVGF